MIDFLSELVIHIISRFGYFGIGFMMFLESALVPIPSEVVMPFSGFVALSGTLSFWLVVTVGVLGQTAGSAFIYFVGAGEGRHLLEKYGKYVLIRKKDIEHADRMFKKHGDAIVFFGRVIPVIRTFISLPAGISKMKFSKFMLYSFLGILPWTLGLAWLGAKMGENWTVLKSYFHILDVFVGIAVVVVIVTYVQNHRRNKNNSD